jgi:hypothetical protein
MHRGDDREPLETSADQRIRVHIVYGVAVDALVEPMSGKPSSDPPYHGIVDPVKVRLRGPVDASHG